MGIKPNRVRRVIEARKLSQDPN